jgi:hypothetical protein
MAKLSVNLKPIAKEISSAEKQLQAILGRVSREYQKEIKTTLNVLDKANKSVRSRCPPRRGGAPHYVVFPPLR